ncbi:polysaccharide pyruvyl transferase family protein [Motilimonas cestriensis]|uniref:Polysaccharide pyruvyl transferase family protein n=1 Tax=Motilimonas cestriensis TaxID=2742685 RepID=A0ABS8WAB2_9GAMM|nr:polysaccharide pyruvyl transferase family protein [Motilimonas cestriensis]MCE2594724.1 polysaccharide pyruvyl transferase family protein [Motilimonas cestriensis]
MSKYQTLKHYLNINNESNKSCYIGWVGYKNLGDEILFDAHNELFPNENFKLYLRSKILDNFFPNAHTYKSAFLGGGTLINQANIWLELLEDFHKKSVPLFCFGTGVVSPDFWNSNVSWGWQNRIQEWADMLKKFEYVGVRGPISCKQLTDLGVKAEIIGDTAISLAPNSVERKLIKGKPVVGINIGFTKGKMWGEEKSFLSEIDKTIKKLLDTGHSIKLLPVWDADIPVNKAIMERFPGKDIDLVLSYENYEGYTNQLKQCDVFVGEKLHATVIATLHRVPSIMIEYRPKCLEYMMSIEMERYCMNTSTFKAEDCIDKVNFLLSNANQVSTELEERILHYKNIQFSKSKQISLGL